MPTTTRRASPAKWWPWAWAPVPPLPPLDLKLGDLDGDGHLDLAVLGATGGTGGELRLYRNAGPANSFAQTQTLALAAAPRALALADLDHDGDLDLAITAATVQLRLNGGNFNFTTAARRAGRQHTGTAGTS